MKKTMTLKREDLLRAIQAVAPGLSPKEIIEQSSCFVVQDDYIGSFNDEITCRCPNPFPKKFTGAIPASKIVRMLEKISADDITAIVTDGRLTIKGKGESAWFRMSDEIQLPIDKVKLPRKWHKLPSAFIEAITIVQECASKADEKTGRTAVHIHPKYVEAYDGYQMARFNLKFKRLETPVLIRKPTMAHVANMGVTHYGETSNWFHFKNSMDQIISCRRLVEEYEDIDQHYEVKGKRISLPKGLSEAADKAGIFSEEDKDNNLVIITVKDGRVKIESLSESGGYEARKKAKFKGDDLTFTIPPTLLKELVARHNECLLTATRLKVDGGRWCYVTALGNPEDSFNKSDEGSESEETPTEE